MMLAQVAGLKPGEFVHTLGDAHLYLNHLEQADLQLARIPRPSPRMRLNPEVTSLFEFRYEDFELLGYARIRILRRRWQCSGGERGVGSGGLDPIPHSPTPHSLLLPLHPAEPAAISPRASFQGRAFRRLRPHFRWSLPLWPRSARSRRPCARVPAPAAPARCGARLGRRPSSTATDRRQRPSPCRRRAGEPHQPRPVSVLGHRHRR